MKLIHPDQATEFFGFEELLYYAYQDPAGRRGIWCGGDRYGDYFETEPDCRLTFGGKAHGMTWRFFYFDKPDHHYFVVFWNDDEFGVKRQKAFEMPKDEFEFQKTFLILDGYANILYNASRCKNKVKRGSPGQAKLRRRKVLLYLAELQSGKTKTKAMEIVEEKLGGAITNIHKARKEFEAAILSNEYEVLGAYETCLRVYGLSRNWERPKDQRYYMADDALQTYSGISAEPPTW
jgi:hypothetical protein